MKIRSTALIAGLVLGTVTIANAQNAPQGAPPQGQPGGQPGQREGGQPRGERGPGGPGGQQRGGVNVGSAMKAMGRALKQLKAQVGDASKKDENLKLVATIQYGCAAAKSAPLPGNITKGMDDAAKAKLDETFRSNLRGVMATAMQLEDAILNGKTDEAAKLVDKLNEQREAGHKAVGLKDED